MKVLFKKLVVNVGHPGDIKEVKAGYAMNCLFPQGLAVELTPATERKMKQELKSQDKHNRELIEDRHKISEELNGKVINFTLKTGSNGKVFGGIGEKEIIREVKKQYKIDLAKKHISLPGGHIKKLGETFVYIKLGKDAMAKMTAIVDAK